MDWKMNFKDSTLIKYYFHGICIAVMLILSELILSTFTVLNSTNLPTLIMFNPPLGTILLFFVYLFVIPLHCGLLNYLLAKRLWRETELKVGFWIWLNGFYLYIVQSIVGTMLKLTLEQWLIRMAFFLFVFPIPMFLGYIGKYIAVKKIILAS
jgi:hypothetical protein